MIKLFKVLTYCFLSIKPYYAYEPWTTDLNTVARLSKPIVDPAFQKKASVTKDIKDITGISSKKDSLRNYLLNHDESNILSPFWKTMVSSGKSCCILFYFFLMICFLVWYRVLG